MNSITLLSQDAQHTKPISRTDCPVTKQARIDALIAALRRVEKETRGYDSMSLIGGVNGMAAKALSIDYDASIGVVRLARSTRRGG